MPRMNSKRKKPRGGGNVPYILKALKTNLDINLTQEVKDTYEVKQATEERI